MQSRYLIPSWIRYKLQYTLFQCSIQSLQYKQRTRKRPFDLTGFIAITSEGLTAEVRELSILSEQ